MRSKNKSDDIPSVVKSTLAHTHEAWGKAKLREAPRMRCKVRTCSVRLERALVETQGIVGVLPQILGAV